MILDWFSAEEARLMKNYTETVIDSRLEMPYTLIDIENVSYFAVALESAYDNFSDPKVELFGYDFVFVCVVTTHYDGTTA